jgi:predicted transposase
MKNLIQIRLNLNDEQAIKLSALQKTFASACDEAAVIMAKNRSWNRVTLHHHAYKNLREKFPALGSQLVCNAIHTVSRASKELFQDPLSPWANIAKSGLPLPLLKFDGTTPVFFDKHTLTLKKNTLSIFTLDGRMQIQLNVEEMIEGNLRSEKLKELSMFRKKDIFYLRFLFSKTRTGAMLLKPSVRVIPNYQETLVV